MKKIFFLLLLTVLFATQQSFAQQGDPTATEMWQPEPKVVTPPDGIQPPSDAIILFDGKSLSEWVSVEDNSPAQWIVKNGVFVVKKGTGNIQTTKSFTDYQLHLEWKIPTKITGTGQGRGNSGLFLASTGEGDSGYEIQILDCFENKTYVNGQTGSVYKQAIPLANACRKPGEWQTYDVIWTAPRFNDGGDLLSPARVTLIHNGILLQNNTVLKGGTVYVGQPAYKKHGPSPIKLQAHGDESEPISFRNIWVREL